MALSNILRSVSDFLKDLETFEKYIPKKSFSHSEEDQPIILTAAKIRELRWMDVPKLRSLFSGRKVRIDDSESAYKELRWLSAQQLAIIFGNEKED